MQTLPRKNLRPNLSIHNTARILLGIAAATVIKLSKKTPLSILSEQRSAVECDPVFTTKSVTWQNVALTVPFGCARENSSKRLNISGNHIIRP